jgi:hypothetical protein
MTSVIVEADRLGAPAPFDLLLVRTMALAPNTIHGVAVIDSDTEVEAIGEIGMGEWITVIDAEGRSREVEVQVPFVPWHRRPSEGVAPTALDDMIAMLNSTAHLL